MGENKNRLTTWPGGGIYWGKDGVPNYRIRRMIGGHLYNVPTRATTLRSAMKPLERFEADPAN